MTFPRQTVALMNEFYGNPDANGDGRPDAKWEAANLTRIEPPYLMFWSWAPARVKTITLHKKCAGAFERALHAVAKEFTAEQIKLAQLDQCGGAYNFRLMRGGNRLSIHSWGAALDLAPERNWLGRAYDEKLGMMPKRVVEIFSNEGLTWGGKWSRPDAMHFQAASV